MYNIGNYVVYKRDVCEVIDIKLKYFNNKDYYVLIPVIDKSLKIDVTIDNKNIRNLVTKDEVEEIINLIPSIEPINCNERLMENEYRILLNSGKHEDLIKIIKTTYLRNHQRLNNNKKIGDKDNYYFELAEKYLYNEFSIPLDMNYEETKKYVIEKVSNLEK